MICIMSITEKICIRCVNDFVCNDKKDRYCYDCYDYKGKYFIDIYYPTKNEKIKKVLVGMCLYKYQVQINNKRLDTYDEAVIYMNRIENL